MLNNRKTSFKGILLTSFVLLLVSSLLTLTAAGADTGGYSFLTAVSEYFGLSHKQSSAAKVTGFDQKWRKNALLKARVNDLIGIAEPDVSFEYLMPAFPTLGVAVTQNFNTLGSSATAALPTDWRVGSSATYSSGTTATTQSAGTSGSGILTSTSTGGTYNFANGVNSSSTDRAVGFLTATGFTSPRQLFVKLTNTTGASLGSATVAYDIEKYRSGSRAYTINFFTSTDGSTWTSQPAGDQAYSADANNNVVSNPPTTTAKSFTVTGLSVPNGTDLYLRWSYTGTGGSTNAQGLGIDNFSFTPLSAPEINVKGNSTSITDGDVTPSAADFTDFGNVNTGSTVSRTFTIENNGSVDLTGGAITFTGANGSEFTVTSPPVFPVISGASTSFTVQFAPLASGTRTATLNIASNDSDENPYDFSIQGIAASPLSGSVNVGTGQTYTSLTKSGGLFSQINAGGLGGNLTVNITSDLAEDGANALNQWTESPAGSNYTVTIQPSGGAVRTLSGNIASGLIKLNGADRVTIDGLNSGGNGLTITNTNNTNGSTCIWLSSLGTGLGATNNTIRNTSLSTGSATVNITYGISISGASVSADGADNDNNTISGNSITKARIGIFASGTAADSNGGVDGLTISGNFVGPATVAGSNQIGAGGILLQNTIGSILSANTIRNVTSGSNSVTPTAIVLNFGVSNATVSQSTITNIITSSTGQAAFGILSGQSMTGMQITRNNITNILATNTGANGSFCAGIYFGSTASQISGNTISGIINAAVGGYPARGIDINTGSSTADVTVVNNSISDIQSYSDPGTGFGFQPTGIVLENSGGLKLYFNSVNLFGSHPGLSSDTIQTALYIDVSTSDLDIRNNIFANTYDNSSSAGDRSYSIYSTASPGAFTHIDFNDYYFGGGTGVLGSSNNGGDLTNLTDWRSATGQDLGSLSTDPFFFDTTNLQPFVGAPVLGGGTPIAGITTDITGAIRSATTPSIGAYETGNVSPGSVRFSSTTFTGTEGQMQAVTVNRVNGTTGTITVDYATSAGSATAGVCGSGGDYVDTTGTLSWADGESGPKTFSVQLCSDAITPEPVETVTLTLSNPVGTTIIGTNPVTLNINDNPPGTVQFSAAAFAGGEGQNTTVTVNRIGGSLGPISVDYATSDGSATGGASCGGADYVTTAGTLSWADGDATAKTFNVQLCADSLLSETSESVVLTLSAPVGTGITGTNPATLVIANSQIGGSIYSNHGAINIPLVGNASPYPSTITVSGFTGNISDMRVTLNDISHTYTSDIDMLLVGPRGQAFVLFSNLGTNNPTSHTTVSLYDSAPGFLGFDPITSGDYKPSNLGLGDVFGLPAPSSGYFNAGPDGSDTFLSTYGGTDPNGVWSLYVLDIANPDGGAVAGGWDLDLQGALPSPGTVQFSAVSYAGDEGSSATITATRSGGSAGAVSVDYASSTGGAIPATSGAACGGSVDYVSTAGTLNWADGDSASKTFDVTICGDVVVESSETALLTLSNPTGGAVIGANNPATLNITNAPPQFCNTAPITIPDRGTATPYPSDITVSGLSGYINSLKVKINNFSHTYPSDVSMLLVGPAGQKFILVSNVGGNTPMSNSTWSIFDAAANPLGNLANPDGQYRPTNFSGGDLFDSPAPAGPYADPAPNGSDTLGGTFNGTDPNGTWSLYVIDGFSGDSGAIAGGWCLEIASSESVQFSAPTYSAIETDAGSTITVNRLGTTGPLTVDYAASNGTATGGAACGAGVDYVNTSGTLSFADGQASRTFNVPLCDDASFDGLKTVNLTLSNLVGVGILGTPSTAVININDNETAPTISISGVTVNEGAGTANFTVTQSAATIVDTNFRFSTANGSALAGFDYTAVVNAPATITAGSTSTTLAIPILQDNGFEDTETFSVTIQNALNAVITTATATGTIIDDDVPANYTVNSLNNVNDGNCNATHCSLREAINASNAIPGIISFAPGLTGTITFSGSRPSITANTVINGPGADVITVSGNNIVSVFDIPSTATSVTIRGLTITNGKNLNFGFAGGINNQGILTILDSVITGNTGSEAGGIQDYGPLTIRNTTLSNNVGGRVTGGCSNTAGAISISAAVPVMISNSTISGNTATGCSFNCGGVMAFDGDVTIDGSTITNNASGSSFSAAVGGNAATPIKVRNSIIAGNVSNNTIPDVIENFISGGFNIIGNTDGVPAFTQPTDQTGTGAAPFDPLLGPLANNGGRTQTHAPMAGSPALDKGFSFGLTMDQRGSTRPYDNPAIANAAGGDGCDIGAYEEQATFGSISLSSATYSDSETNADHTFNIPVTRTGGAGGAVSVNYAVTDGTATTADNDYSVSPSTGTLNWADGDAAAKNIVITVKGDTNFEPDETVNIAITSPGGGAALGTPNTAVLTITNDDPGPTIGLDTGSLTFAGQHVGSTSGAQTVTISNTGGAPLNLGTLSKTGTNASDFAITTDPSGTVIGPGGSAPLQVTFSPSAVGSRSASISIPSNDTANPIKTVTLTGTGTTDFNLTLIGANGSITPDIAPNGASGGYLPGTVVTLTPVANAGYTFWKWTGACSGSGACVVTMDADKSVTANFVQTPSFLVGSRIQIEGDSGTRTFIISVFRNPFPPSPLTSTVDYTTVDGTATAADGDYIPTSGTLTFGPGQNSANVAVTVNGDTTVEPDETFTLHLSNPTTATIANPDGTATIINDDNISGFIVRSTSDGISGSCGANCTLRDAVNAANANINLNTITFDFNPGDPGCTAGACTITLSSTVFINRSVYIDGPGANLLTINGGTGNNRIFQSNSQGNFRLKGMTLESGDITFDQGGAVYVISATLFTLDSVVLRNNTSAFNEGGGAISFWQGGFEILNSTITGNSAPECGGMKLSNGELTISNSTFSGNTATQRQGGGACFYGDSHVTVRKSTFTANTAVGSGGGIRNYNTSTLNIGDSIVAGNTSPVSDLYNEAPAHLFTSGYNLIGDNAGSAGVFPVGSPNGNKDIVGAAGSIVDAMLGSLTDNGGPTPTHALNTGSPAIDKGSLVAGVTVDQRGFGRPSDNILIANAPGGDGSDIGAFEVQLSREIDVTGGIPAVSITDGDISPDTADGTDFGSVAVGSHTDHIFTINNSGTGPLSLAGGVTVVGDAGFTILVQPDPSVPAGGSSTFTVRYEPVAAPVASFATVHIASDDADEGDFDFAVSAISFIQTYTVTPSSSGGGSISPDTPQTVNAGSNLTFTFTPFPGNYVTDVVVDGVMQAGPPADYTFTDIQTDHSISVTFAPIEFTLTLNAINGHIDANPSPIGGKYAINTTVTLTPVADPGYHFVDWSGDCIGSGACSVTMTSDKTVTATFAIDQPGTIKFVSATYSVGEAGGVAQITVERVNGSDRQVDATFNTQDGTATDADNDYEPVNGYTVSYANGETGIKTIDITVNNDAIYETNETVNLTLSGTTVNRQAPVKSARTSTSIGDSAILTITDDDAVPTFSIDDVIQAEGNAGTTSFTFTVTKTGATELDSSVDYSTADGSAVSPSDFTAIGSTTLNFLPADTTKQITVLVNGDAAVEPDESFTVQLVNPTGASIIDGSGTGTITNDDFCTPPNTVYVDDDWAGTPLGTDPDLGGPASQFGCDSFATIQGGINGVVAPGQVIVAAGTYSENPTVGKAVTLKGAGFGVDGRTRAAAESMVQTNGSQNAVFTITSANVTIDGFTIDGDDPLVAGAPLFSGDDANASYGVRPTGAVSNLNISNNIVRHVFIGFRGDGASQGNVVSRNLFDSIGNFDFGYCVSLRNNFYADVTDNKMTRAWSGVHTNSNNGSGGPANFLITGNEIHSYAGGILYWLQFSGATGATIDGNQLTAESGAVTNNFGVLMISVQNAVTPVFTGNTITGHNYGMGLFNVSTSNNITLGATNVITGSSKAGVFLTDNLNFDPILSTDFMAGGPGQPSTVNISGMSITGNTGSGIKVEGTTNVQNAVITGATISGVPGGNALEMENSFAAATMTASTLTGFGTGIHLNNTGAGTQNVTAHYNRIVQDSAAIQSSGGGAFNADLENNWWGCNAGPGDAACGTVSAGAGVDYTPWIVLGTTATPNPIAPGSNANVTADMTHNSDSAIPSAVDFIPAVGVGFSSTGGTIAPPSGTITSGQAGAVFTSTSSLPATACSTVDNQTACTNIAVDQPSFAIGDVTQAEGDAGTTAFTFNVIKTGVTAFTASVDFETINGTAIAPGDYTAISPTTLTFGPADTSLPVTVLVKGDTVFENNEAFLVHLSNPSGATISDADATGTITNDDSAPTISIADVTMAEGNAGTTAFNFTLTKTGATELDATGDFTTNNGTAIGGICGTSGVDYLGTGGNFGFLPGESSKTITVSVCGDTDYELSDTFTVDLSNPANATLADAQGLGTIVNDDPIPTITISDVTQAEGDTGTTGFTFTVTRTGASGVNSTVDYSTVAGTATDGTDFTPITATQLTFLPGEQTKPVTVMVNGDTTFETNETFTVHLANVVNASITDADGAGTITNDDTAPTLSISDYTYPVGTDSFAPVGGGFVVSLSGATEVYPVTAHYATSDNTATQPSDYTATAGTLTFNSSASQTITVPVVSDTVQEPTETFFVDLDTPANATILDGHAIGTIPNDDAPPTFAIDDVSHAEGNAGTTAYTFTITKTGQTALSSTVSFTTQDGTATVANNDYSANSGSVNFLSSDTTKTVTVLVNGDTTVETDEAFTVHLTSTDNGTFTDADGTGTIVNDDTSVQFSAATYMEDESQTAAIIITRAGDTSGTTNATFDTVAGGSATGGAACTSGVDYITVTAKPVTFDPGTTQKTVDVILCGDSLTEPVQTVNLALTGAAVGTPATAILKVNDTASLAGYRNVNPITMTQGAAGDPYPSQIVVTGAPALLGTLRVTLYDVSQTFPDNLDVLLQGPGGQTYMLMADAGGANPIDPAAPVTLTFSDVGSLLLPNSNPLTTGSFLPTTWEPGQSSFPLPAPAGPYTQPGSSVARPNSLKMFGSFGLRDANGTWSLWIRDDNGTPFAPGAIVGQIAGGWGLELLPPTAAAVSVQGRVLTADGRGIRNAFVTLTDTNGVVRNATTGSLGYYTFENVSAGETYIIGVESKRFHFTQRVVQVFDSLTDVDLVAQQ